MRCHDASLDLGEPLAGTAPVAPRWLLVAYGGAWAAKRELDLAEGISPEVRDRLQAVDARAQLVRRREDVGPTLFLAVTIPGQERLHRLDLSRWEDALDLDLDGILDGSVPWAEAKPIFLVCTHGRRDACCALHGTALFAAMSAVRPDQVWQSSHLGGHRFAAVCTALPSGVVYGRLTPGDAGALVAAEEAGEVYDPAKIRGRSGWPAAVQAAEVALRERTGERGPLTFDGVDEDEVRLALGDVGWRVRVTRRALGHAPASCGAEPAPVHGWFADVVE
jgi:hypothetical protein